MKSESSSEEIIVRKENEVMYLHYCGCGYRRVVSAGDYPPITCPKCKSVRSVAYMSARLFNNNRLAKFVANLLLIFQSLIFIHGCFISTDINEREEIMYSDNVITANCVLPSRRFDTPVETALAGEAIVKGNTLVTHWSAPNVPDNLVWKSRVPFYNLEPAGDQANADIYVGVALDSANVGEPVRYSSVGMLVEVLFDVSSAITGGFTSIPKGTLLTLTNEDDAEPVGLAKVWDWHVDHGVLNQEYMKQLIGHLACVYDAAVIDPAPATDLVPVILHPFVLPWTATPI
jgi:hypothetical protein